MNLAIRILLTAATFAVYIHPTVTRAAEAPPIEMPSDFDVQCNDNSDDVTEWCEGTFDEPTLPPTECKCPPGRPRLTSSLCCIRVGVDPDLCFPCQYGCHKTDDGLTCNSKP